MTILDYYHYQTSEVYGLKNGKIWPLKNADMVLKTVKYGPKKKQKYGLKFFF